MHSIALIALGYTIVYGIVEIDQSRTATCSMMGAFLALTLVAASGVTSGDPMYQIVGIFLIACGANIFSGTINLPRSLGRLPAVAQRAQAGSLSVNSGQT